MLKTLFRHTINFAFLLLLVLVKPFNLYAWNSNNPVGARSSALVGASTTLTDIYSVQNNQAGLTGVKTASGALFFENRYLLKELSYKGGIIALPTKTGTFGLLVNSFGGKNYSENKFGLSFAKAFGDAINAGVQLDYLSTKFGDSYYGKAVKFALEVGIQARILKNLYIGAHLFNPSRTKLTETTLYKEKIPTILKLGLRYNFSKVLLMTAEAEKDIQANPLYKCGIEYQLVNSFFLRAGVSNGAFKNSFGFGFNSQLLKIDFAMSYHQVLGLSPQLSLSLNLKDKSTK